MDKIMQIARKEFATFFASPIAFIFLGTFLAVTLFVFFWVETFFARNIADVRPLFEWMPVLLIFLVAAISMRMWAEERRAGTLEFLLTAPVRPLYFVLGKFIACLALVATALLLTLPLPITVSMLGHLDWGPVLAGYVAALFLAAAYIAIGLFISARSDNQIISLILTVVVCGIFYLLGSPALTDLFGTRASDWLQALGSGSRFTSITRGVIDLRDLYYYLSLVGLFLTLNVFTLEWLRWAGNARNAAHRQWGLLTVLLGANFLAGNLWLAPVSAARADFTEGNMYSISKATRDYLAQLREPLLIRGYFSAQTHPLLAPLVPQVRDLLEEYAIAGKGKVRIEVVDPAEDARIEQEAGEKYSIRPVPFQMASKYQASVVNSYFDILVKYGDQFETLGFRDLIEYKMEDANMDVRVTLRNPEYDITQAIKKVLYAYQASGQLFANIEHPIVLQAYISANNTLPDVLQTLKSDLLSIAEALKREAGDKFSLEVTDPNTSGGALAAQLEQDYGFRPMAAGLFDPQTFWFYLLLKGNEQTVQIPLPEDLSKASLEQSVNAALKRFSKGFLKNVALHTSEAPSMPHMGMRGGEKQFSWLRIALQQNHNVIDASLDNGMVPEEADLLIVAAPENLDEKQVFAIDQFLMRGGTVVVATAPYEVSLQRNLSAEQKASGLEDWLKHHGVHIEKRFVLDTQNAAFPIPMQRRVGAFTVQETRMLDYPYFIDIRDNGMAQDSGLLAGLNQITLGWASPLTLDAEVNAQRKVIELLHSTPSSWTSDNLNIQPDFAVHASGFATGKPEGEKTLAALVEGEFTSFFKGKDSPLLQPDREEDQESAQAEDKKDDIPVISRMIDKSPQSSRLIVLASNSALTDNTLNLLSSGMGTRYINPIELVANAVDWSLEERGLLSIRGRNHYSRTLYPLSGEQQMFWEYLNYALALLALAGVWVLHWHLRRRKRQHYHTLLAQ